MSQFALLEIGELGVRADLFITATNWSQSVRYRTMHCVELGPVHSVQSPADQCGVSLHTCLDPCHCRSSQLDPPNAPHSGDGADAEIDSEFQQTADSRSGNQPASRQLTATLNSWPGPGGVVPCTAVQNSYVLYVQSYAVCVSDPETSEYYVKRMIVVFYGQAQISYAIW